jgi:hypothetical protein
LQSSTLVNKKNGSLTLIGGKGVKGVGGSLSLNFAF